MDYASLNYLFGNNASLKLFRAKNAPLIISFLYSEFKEKKRITIPYHEMENNLADYINKLQKDGITVDESESESEMSTVDERRQIAKRYLNDWCSDDNSYIIKYVDIKNIQQIELTTNIEKVFTWITGLNKREFVGTESRYLDILRRIQEIIEYSSVNPEIRISELEKRKSDIEFEINEIKKTGIVTQFSDVQITERFFELNKIARELLGDFKEVEQNFKELVRQIYKQQSEKKLKKGDILEFTLDSSDELKNSPQGQSFYSFWQSLMNDSARDELRSITERLYGLLDDKNIKSSDDFIKNIRFYLHQSGKKIIETNHTLSDKLSRILVEKNVFQHQKTMELIADIKQLALKRIGTATDEEWDIEIDGYPDVSMIMDRPFNFEDEEIVLEKHPEEKGGTDNTEISMDLLFNKFEIDREILENNISNLLLDKKQITLIDVLERFPVSKGLEELITYLSIASSRPSHIIVDDTYEYVEVLLDGVIKKISIPRVIFTK